MKSNKLPDYCKCSGRFVNTEAPARFRASMQVFLNIADHHSFLWLKDAVMFAVDGVC